MSDSHKLDALWKVLLARTDYERCERPRAARLSLAGMERLCLRLGRPERACPALHVAGSKGKGTVAHLLERGLRSAGCRTGLYTSPHLEDWRERIQVDGASPPDHALAGALEQVLAVAEGDESFFDLLTASAFVAFRDARVDVAVIEVGLGGRADSTNVVRPLAAAVTSIELEHVEVLGPTLAHIAREKAGIFKPGAAAWCGPGMPAEALVVLRAAAADVGEALRAVPARADAVPEGLRAHPLPHVRGLGALACAMLDALPLPFLRGAAALSALDSEALELPGRYERRALADGRRLLLDIAHTEHSLRAVLAAFRAEHPDPAERGILFALREEKDPAALARALGPAPAGERWWTCPAGDHPRSADPARLAAAFGARALSAPSFPRGPRALLVTGSTYLVGALRGATLPRAAPAAARA